MARPRPELVPEVRFEPGFAARVAGALTRLRRRGSARESEGRAWIAGAGDDLAGLRPYRPGDDPRAIDWSASARAERAVVRVLRRRRGGRHAVVLDASLSMAVGPPGKLQRAAEVAAALAAHAVRSGALAEVIVLPAGRRFELARADALAGLLARLEGVRAEGRLRDAPPRVARGGAGARAGARPERLTWIGDLAGADPEHLARVAAPGVALAVLQVLAPVEIAPGALGPVAWWEPEEDRWLEVDVDAATAARHGQAAERRFEALARVLARRGARVVRASSAEPFEGPLGRLLA